MQSAADVAALAFHEVTDHPSDTGFQRPGAVPFTLSRAAFERCLDRIADAPVAPTLVTDADVALPGRRLLLTFDDGGRSALDAADAIARRGWRGHFFVVTSRIGSRTFLAARMIRLLRDAGHVVGSHSHTHPDICRELPPARMAEEWRVSAEILADLLGEPCEWASVPGGEISPTVLATAADAGFRFIFTIEPTLRPAAIGGAWILGRHLVKARMPTERIGELAEFRGWRGALVTRRLKGLVRRAVPPLYRHIVARRTRELAHDGR
jgi:peptidoglycan/xylan/chitin deacetylase (PgdA/CDA1 family)